MRRFSIRTLLVTLIAVLVVGGAGVWLYASGRLGTPQVDAESLQRVLIVAASPDEHDNAVGQIILVVDLSNETPRVDPVSPALPVTIPGTSYRTLGDAYPFGRGAGTSAALASARGEETLPYVALSPERLAEAVKTAGGVDLVLPAPMSVFDGDELYAFEEGEQHLSSAELRALLKGAPYLSDSERARLDESLAHALVRALAASPEAVTSAQTDLDASALSRLQDALGRLSDDVSPE